MDLVLGAVENCKRKSVTYFLLLVCVLISLLGVFLVIRIVGSIVIAIILLLLLLYMMDKLG